LNPRLTRLEEARDDLARRWLVRVIEASSLEDVARLPVDRIARELPELISDVLRGAGQSAQPPSDRGAPSSRWSDAGVGDAARAAARLANLSAPEAPDPAGLVRAVGALESVLIGGLAETVAEPDARAALADADRIGRSLGAVLEAAVSQEVDARSRELESLANTDALTGLFNVRHLREHLAHLVGIQQRYGHPFAVLLLDVDGLKRINDAYGHAVGNRSLVSIAETLRATIRSIDTAVRVGGDEFCVLAPDQTAPRVRALGERIADAVDRLETPEGARVSVSVGVVSCPQNAVEPDRLLELADEAMYRAKASGSRVAIAAGLSEAAGSESSAPG
jgi:diguanylate cyclase (GGDEF)-like protein